MGTFSCFRQVAMANAALLSHIIGYCLVGLKFNIFSYHGDYFLRNHCCNTILGHDFLQQHSFIKIPFRGTKPALNICELTTDMPYPSLITNDSWQIAIKSRQYTKDKQFINTEITRMFEEGIIEVSLSPWRAQFHVMSSEKNLFADYLQTINKIILLDAYPLSCIDKYHVYSMLDLQSAYHQVWHRI